MINSTEQLRRWSTTATSDPNGNIYDSGSLVDTGGTPGGHDLQLPRGGGTEKSKAKRFYKKFNFKKSFLHFKGSKQSKRVNGDEDSKLSQRDKLNFSKSDENLIRIRVPYNCEEDYDETDYRSSCVSEVLVDYNPSISEFGYNEKAVDVPEEFVRNQWICRRRWRPMNGGYPTYFGSVKDLRTQDWITSQTPQPTSSSSSSVTQTLTDFNRNYELTNVSPRINSPYEMGTVCSTRFPTHSVAPEQRSSTPIYVGRTLPALPSVSSLSTSRHLTVSENRIDIYPPNLFSSPFHSTSSRIQEDNILHRSNNVCRTPPKHHSSMLELSSAKSKLRTSSRPVASDSQAIRHSDPPSLSSPSRGGFLKSFGGSFQNLSLFGRIERGRQRKSASENNLAEIEERKLNQKSKSIVFGGVSGRNGSKENEIIGKNPRTRGARKFFEFNMPKMKRFKERQRM